MEITLINFLCRICSNEFSYERCSLYQKAKRDATEARRTKTPKRITWKKQYDQSEKAKEAQRRYYANTGKLQNKKYDLKRHYNLSIEAFNWMLLDQGYMCAICFRSIDKLTAKIDHDHETNKVRGLLCHACNIKMAALDNLNFMKKAVSYKTNGYEL